MRISIKKEVIQRLRKRTELELALKILWDSKLLSQMKPDKIYPCELEIINNIVEQRLIKIVLKEVSR